MYSNTIRDIRENDFFYIKKESAIITTAKWNNISSQSFELLLIKFTKRKPQRTPTITHAMITKIPGIKFYPSLSESVVTYLINYYEQSL